MGPVQASDLPTSAFVGVAKSTLELEDLLIKASGSSNVMFRYFDRAVGGPRSCRMVFQEAVPGFTTTGPLREPHSARVTAAELFREGFMREVRYSPTDAPSPRSVKGWEVRVAHADNKMIIIVLSAWVTPLRSFAALFHDGGVGANELKEVFRDYVKSGAAISAQVVIRLIERTNPSDADREEMKALAMEGAADQTRRHFNKDADAYRQVAVHL